MTIDVDSTTRSCSVPIEDLRRMQRDLVRAFPYNRDVHAKQVLARVRSGYRSRASSVRSGGP